MFAARLGDVEALKILIKRQPSELDFQDNDKGYTAAMAAAHEGHVESFHLLVYAGANVKLRNNAGETVISLSEISQKRDLFEKVMLEYALKMDDGNHADFYALHCAIRRNDMEAVKLLTNKGYDVNVVDRKGYTPLMLAAKEDNGKICQLLISQGASCDVKSFKGETALALARKSGSNAESVILDELARKMVLRGAFVIKHTKGGRGKPHGKTIKMMEHSGVLQWGKSRERNVVCREVEVGPSDIFKQKRRGKAGCQIYTCFEVQFVAWMDLRPGQLSNMENSCSSLCASIIQPIHSDRLKLLQNMVPGFNKAHSITMGQSCCSSLHILGRIVFSI